MEKKLKGLTLCGLTGAPTSPLVPLITGRSFLLVNNPLGYQTLRFDFFASDFCRIQIVNARGTHLLVGRLDGKWQRIRTRLHSEQPEEVTVQCRWTREDTFAFRFCVLDSPKCTTFTCHFDQELLRLHYQDSVGNPDALSVEMLGWCIQRQKPR